MTYLYISQVAAIVQTLNEIDNDDDDDGEEEGKIELPPDKLVWIGCAVREAIFWLEF